MNERHRQTVARGYDHVAEAYLSTKDPEDRISLQALEELASVVPGGGGILDLSCGAGIPATRWLSKRRFSVTGVDFSARQLDLARQLVPGAVFIQLDMTELDFPPDSFDAAVAVHSIIHVSREEDPMMLEKIHNWLKPGGVLLATLSMTDSEGEDPDWQGWGAAMRWSHYDWETNLAMLDAAGFDIHSAESRTGDDGEPWLWTLARKDSRP